MSRVVIPTELVPDEALKNQPRLPQKKWGKADITPKIVEADALEYFTITYVVGLEPIKKGEGISLHIPERGWSAPVFNKNERGYIQASTTGAAKLKYYRPRPEIPQSRHWATFEVVSGVLKNGDKITILYGGEKGKGPGAEVANFPGKNIRFFMTRTTNPFPAYFGNVSARTYPGLMIFKDRFQVEPELEIIGAGAECLQLTLPTTACGGVVKLQMHLQDRCHNPASSAVDERVVNIYWDNGDGVVKSCGRKLASVQLGGKSNFRKKMDVKTPNKNGVYYLFAEWGGEKWMSNPVHISNKAEGNIYWGDLHAQGFQSDGYGYPEDYFSRARDEAALDIACLTDHSDGLCFPIMHDCNTPNDKKWENLCRITKKMNKDDSFVTFAAMELSSDVKHFPSGLRERNHRNAYFYDEEDSVCFSWRDFPDTWDWYRFLKDTKYMIIPHTHEARLDCMAHNPFAERLIEIMSDKGSGENKYVEGVSATSEHGGVLEFLRKGCRVGIVGSGDYHHNTPGRHFPQKEVAGFADSQTFMGGLAAIKAKKLNRKEIWGAMYDRQAYATTGVRIYLEFNMKFKGVTPMSGEKVVKPNEKGGREFSVEYALTAPLKEIQLIRNGEVDAPVDVYRNKELVKSSGFDKKQYAGKIKLADKNNLGTLWLDSSYPPILPHKFVFYYIRILQEDGEIAWSSPIWISDRDIIASLDK